MENQALLPKIPDFMWAKALGEKALVQFSEFRAEIKAMVDAQQSAFDAGLWYGAIGLAVLILIVREFSRSRQ